MRIRAPIVLATDYGVAGWLAFYLPSHPFVAQVNERMRYVDLPQPDPALFAGNSMYVCETPCGALWQMKEKFSNVELVATFPRTRHGVTIKEYSAYSLSGPTRQVLDPPLAEQH
jgi:hypothetical protein